MTDYARILTLVCRLPQEPHFDIRGVDVYRIAFAIGYCARLAYLTDSEDS